MEILALDRATIRGSCSMLDAIDAVETGFRALSTGSAHVPIRSRLALREADAGVLLMPARIDEEPFASVKVVAVVPSNRGRGLPAISAVVMLLDCGTGVPVAFLEGAEITALRTGAAGGLAARHLARRDARIVTLYGAGIQARAQLDALMAVCSIDEVRVVARSRTSAGRFIRSLGAVSARVSIGDRHAAEGADIIVCATSASRPVFDAGDLRPGVHITGVGSYRPDMIEIPPDAFKGAKVVVDQRAAALAESGELIDAIARGHVLQEDLLEIGDPAARRATEDERTIFKSVGSAVQDLVIARHVYSVARTRGLGTPMHL